MALLNGYTLLSVDPFSSSLFENALMSEAVVEKDGAQITVPIEISGVAMVAFNGMITDMIEDAINHALSLYDQTPVSQPSP